MPLTLHPDLEQLSADLEGPEAEQVAAAFLGLQTDDILLGDAVCLMSHVLACIRSCEASIIDAQDVGKFRTCIRARLGRRAS